MILQLRPEDFKKSYLEDSSHVESLKVFYLLEEDNYYLFYSGNSNDFWTTFASQSSKDNYSEIVKTYFLNYKDLTVIVSKPLEFVNVKIVSSVDSLREHLESQKLLNNSSSGVTL